MDVCNGRGDVGGDHCCYLDGEVCKFLITDQAGTPRCSLYAEWGALNDNPEWVSSPAGQFYARLYPGYTCADWPQNIPNVRGGVCCWEGKL